MQSQRFPVPYDKSQSMIYDSLFHLSLVNWSNFVDSSLKAKKGLLNAYLLDPEGTLFNEYKSFLERGRKVFA